MIIDAHIHVGPMARQYVQDYSLETLLNKMDKLSIEQAISTNTYVLDHLDFAYGAQLGSDLYRRSSGRIRSYHYYHPGKQAQSLAAMDRYVDDPAYVGIKIHPSWAWTSADDERWRPVWEYAAAHKLPILAHTWDLSPTNPKQAYAFPARFEKFVREYPSVKLILAHSGGRCGGIRAAAALGQKYPNVYVDIAGDIWPNGFLEFIARAIGAERILFGSDYTMMDQELMLGVVVGASLSIPEKENILYNNAKALFRL